MNYYSVNTEHCAYESMENEIVIIHLDNGNYFNLEGIAIDVWNAIVSEVSIQDLIDLINNAYEADKNVITEAINNFIEQLKAEELIIESSPSNTNNSSFELENVQSEFKPPTLDKYEDMQDLLLLDPLHDVDENVGWPATKTMNN